MHIISQRRIKEASQRHTTCSNALDQWYKVMKKAKLRDFAQLKALFNSADKVGDLYVFNIGGNKLRLIAAIHFNRQKLFIREILNHTEYDQDKWRT
ncbi:MAG: type II toxin-antitoxin system HigB family toxin [Ectothiorhodospiraceae bacterium]|nr:type II toxin-antitoxin system HigB family toxin [Ectothiorhodospiraceae bacterium]